MYLNWNSYSHRDSLLIPFSREMWIIIISLVVVFTLVLTFMKHIETFSKTNVYNENNDYTSYKVTDKSWSENVIVVVGVFCGQGRVVTDCITSLPIYVS